VVVLRGRSLTRAHLSFVEHLRAASAAKV
jgi:hypothetical protein